MLLDGDFAIDVKSRQRQRRRLMGTRHRCQHDLRADFTVRGFNKVANGVWSNAGGYSFSQLSGLLTYGTSPIGGGEAAVPEPATIGLVGLAGMTLLRRRRA